MQKMRALQRSRTFAHAERAGFAENPSNSSLPLKVHGAAVVKVNESAQTGANETVLELLYYDFARIAFYHTLVFMLLQSILSRISFGKVRRKIKLA